MKLDLTLCKHLILSPCTCILSYDVIERGLIIFRMV